ncbi:MAG: hypothetical protein RR101_15295 [Burkholderiaceae bacterium]
MTHPAGDYALTVGDRVAIGLTVASGTGARRPLVTVTGTVYAVTPAAVVLASGDTHGLRAIPFTAIAVIELIPAPHPGL